MNRRNFLNSLLVAGASFTIMPGAGRVWRARRDVENERYIQKVHHAWDGYEWVTEFRYQGTTLLSISEFSKRVIERPPPPLAPAPQSGGA